MRKSTTFTFYKNTPLVFFNRVIHFKSNYERDNFFQTHYEKLDPVTLEKFNFIRSELKVRLPIDFDDMLGVNYMSFNSDFESAITFYCFVDDYRYIQDGVVEVSFSPDVLTTFLSYDFSVDIHNTLTERQHVSKLYFDTNQRWLLSNNDILETYSMRYIAQDFLKFSDYTVIFRTSADFTQDFGTQEKPTFAVSKGQSYDRIPSPLDLYVCDYTNFKKLTAALTNYAYVAQNFEKIILFPTLALDTSLLMTATDLNAQLQGVTLQRFGGDSQSKNIDLSALDFTTDQMLSLAGFNGDMNLLRKAYFNIDLFDWGGNSITIDPAQLSGDLHLEMMNVIGYANSFSIYVRGYKEYNEIKIGGGAPDIPTGSFLNDSMNVSNFDDIPVLINNYKLSLETSANTRQLSEQRLLTNRIESIVDPKTSLTDRVGQSLGLLGNFSATAIGGKLTEEYEFYRTQKAQFEDKALSKPSLTTQSTGQAFQIANDIAGVTVKYSAISGDEITKVRKYYALMGYQVLSYGDAQSIENMTIVNYYKGATKLLLPNIPVAFNKLVNTLLDGGVEFWHNNGSDNPFNQDILQNERIDL